MRLVPELRARARHVVGPVLGVSIAAYLVYHLIHGDRGLFSWWDLRQEIETARAILAETSATRERLEHRVRLLSPAGLDLDMLDERARVMLNYGRPDELVIHYPRPAP